MKKYDFLPSTVQWRAKKQTFCKNVQWRAKKLRERGSSTARPTEKGVGGLLIRSRFGRFGRFRRVASCRFGRFRRVASCRFGRFRRDLRTSSWRFVLIRSIRSCRVAIWRVGRVDCADLECCLCRDLACRSSRRTEADAEGKAQTQKSPIPQSENRAQLSQGVARS